MFLFNMSIHKVLIGVDFDNLIGFSAPLEQKVLVLIVLGTRYIYTPPVQLFKGFIKKKLVNMIPPKLEFTCCEK